jgi:nitrogen fixation protein NifZ
MRSGPEAIEVYDPPIFREGQKVAARNQIRSDGTVYGTRTGDVILEAGEMGYVAGIGEFLQRFYIYEVDFVDSGRRLGMRGFELKPLEE